MSTFHTGFSSLGADGYETELDRGGEYGFDFVELTMNDYPAAELDANADRIRSLAREHGLDLIVHLPHGGRDAMIGSTDDRVREKSIQQFAAAIEAAGSIGAGKAVLHADSSDELLLAEAGRFDELYTAVEELAEVANENDVELCVENMLGRKRRRLSPRDVVRVAERTGASMTFDTGHARTMGYDDEAAASFLREHADVVSHFHLNDTRGPSDEHLPFGAGTIDFETILGSLPADWEGTLTMEISTPSYDYVEFSHRKLLCTLKRIE